MDPKQCLIDVEDIINRARATRVKDRATSDHRNELFSIAAERLRNYREWRRNGGFQPMFPTFQGGKEDIPGDTWADHFEKVLKSFGVQIVPLGN